MLAERFPTLSKLIQELNAQVDQDRVPHARLLVGKTGSGLLRLAMDHASYLLTGQVGDEQVEQMVHPDLHFSFPIVLKSGVGSSDDYMEEWRTQVSDDPFFGIRTWTNRISGDMNKSAIIGRHESDRIMSKLTLKSFLGGNKVLIIWKADLTNTATSNKLLKLIEEPPPNTFIILLAESTEDILPTILSRCQLQYVPELSIGEMTEYLVTELDISTEEAKNLASLSEGDLHLAKSLAGEESDELVFHDLFVNWMRLCYKKDVPGIIDWIEDVNFLKRERQKSFFSYCLNFFRQCMLNRYVGEEASALFGREKEFAGKFGKFVHGANVVELMTIFDREHYHLERNGNAKLIMLELSFNIIRLLHVEIPKPEVAG